MHTRPRVAQYEKFFAGLSDERFAPYSYQLEVAESLWQRKNLVLRAPTGTGKTVAVLAPFLYSRETIGAARLIYALPLRSLAQGIYQQAQEACKRLGNGLDVRMQTGEQPDDPFFTLGDIVVTTYDQVLSGLLCGPYGLPEKLRNINGAIAAGNLIVFDEFHLMQTHRAFLTAVACLRMFGGAVRSVWMTATATSPLTDLLKRELGASEVRLSDDELSALPSVALVSRRVQKEPGQLTAETVLAHQGERSVVIVNRVSRAQELGRRIAELAQERGVYVPVEVLHARFFAPDRKTKQDRLRAWFGPKPNGPAILITTQVVEAGINISCEHLHTDVCPMNALVQRAGRCARFPGETGTVHVYDVGAESLPYEHGELRRAWELLPDEPAEVDPGTAVRWVEAAHRGEDALTLQRYKPAARRQECEERIWNNLVGQNRGGVADLIRGQSDSVRVAVCDDPRGLTPGEMECVSLYRNQLGRLIASGSVWSFDADQGWIAGGDPSLIARSYAVAIPRAAARYTPEFGLELGQAGDRESPRRQPPKRPGYPALKRESWVHHTRCVMAEARLRLAREAGAGGILFDSLAAAPLAELVDWSALLHDFGKLQAQWQRWAEAAQRARDASYRHSELLAHTDFDFSDADDRARIRAVQPSRPHHSAASAYYGLRVLERAAPSLSRTAMAACTAAVLGHHGGWAEPTVLPLDSRWGSNLGTFRKEAVETELAAPSVAEVTRLLETGLRSACLLDFGAWWPLAAYLTRTLRLSDQLATEEGNKDG